MQKQQIGKRHRQVREEVLKMSVADYARMMEVKEVTVYSWESGRTSVPHAVMAALEERYGVAAGWMITGEGAMRRQDREATTTDELRRHVEALQETLDKLRTEASRCCPWPSRPDSPRPPMIPSNARSTWPICCFNTPIARTSSASWATP